MVINPKLYQQQIEDMGIDGLNVEPSSLPDAMNLLIKLKKDYRILLQIKYNLRMDSRKIRQEYMEKINSLQESSKVLGLFNKKLDEKEARKAKKILLTERDDVLAPYDGLERLADNYLEQIDYYKSFLDKYIEDNLNK